MSDIQLGISGAKRATWREADPRPCLRKILEENPNADRAELFGLFWDEIRDEEDHIKSMVEYWFDLALGALQRSKPSPEVKHARAEILRTRAAETRTVVEKIKTRIEHEARVVLLTLIMPNGKKLGECTGKECRKFGSWYSVLGRSVPPRKTVASVLSEDQVYRIWQTVKA